MLPGPIRPVVLSVPVAKQTKPSHALFSLQIPLHLSDGMDTTDVVPTNAVNDVQVGNLVSTNPADVRRHIMFAGLGINGSRDIVTSDISAAIVLHF